MKEDLIIYGGTALLVNSSMETLANVVIEISKGKITSIKSMQQFTPPPDIRSINASSTLILPGLINCHTHAAMGLFRGIAEDLPLMRWLRERIFPLEKALLSENFNFIGALVCGAEFIQTGTTTFNNMDYYPQAILKAASELGLRIVCGMTLIEDHPGSQTKQIDFGQFLDWVQATPLAYASLCPHAVYSISEKTIKNTLEFCERHSVRIHLHVSEVKDELEFCQKKYGMTPVELLERSGIFNLPTVAAHAAAVNESDIEILGKYRVGIAHNCQANLKLGAPICPVTELRAAGATVGIGTDGPASNNNLDLLEEADTVGKLQAFKYGPGALTAIDIVRMLTIEGAKVLGLQNEIGSLEVGKQADIICVDLKKPHALPMYDPYTHLVYSAKGSDVKHTIVNGRILMENYRLLTVNLTDLAHQVGEWKKRVEELA